jgi:hypothetical protein
VPDGEIGEFFFELDDGHAGCVKEEVLVRNFAAVTAKYSALLVCLVVCGELWKAITQPA